MNLVRPPSEAVSLMVNDSLRHTLKSCPAAFFSLPRASPGVRTPGRPRSPARDRGTLRELSMASAEDRNPIHHTEKMQKALREIQKHLREDIEKVDEPQFKAMFETAAEVLGGLIKAFGDYKENNESAWRKAS